MQTPDFVFTKKQALPFSERQPQEKRKKQTNKSLEKKKKLKGAKDKHPELYQSFLIQMSNITGGEGSFSSGYTGDEVHQEKQQPQLQHPFHGSGSGPSGTTSHSNSTSQQQQQQPVKKKRNLPGTPGKFN